MMEQKFICPECHEQEVVRIDACGSSGFFCEHCKKLFSTKRVKEANPEANPDDF